MHEPATLVSLHCHFLCRCLSDERGAALRDRCLGWALSVAVRLAARRGTLVVDCKCAVGGDELDHRICFVPRRPVSIPPDTAGAAIRRWRAGYGAPSGTEFWPLSRRTHIDAFPSLFIPASQADSLWDTFLSRLMGFISGFA